MDKKKSKKKDRIYIESMTAAKMDGLKVRVWKKEKDFNYSAVSNAIHVKEQLRIANKKHEDNKKMIAQHLLLSNKSINAVEVLSEWSGDGIVLYKNWP